MGDAFVPDDAPIALRGGATAMWFALLAFPLTTSLPRPVRRRASDLR
jgi:hypothetical protein